MLSRVRRGVATGPTETVIGSALCRVAKHLVSLVKCLEVGFCIGCLVNVGVVLAGQPAERALDLLRAGGGGDA
jgi:hypothetical protein